MKQQYSKSIVYTEAQLAVLESAKCKLESDPDKIEKAHPTDLIAQDNFYVDHLKGVGRIYQ